MVLYKNHKTFTVRCLTKRQAGGMDVLDQSRALEALLNERDAGYQREPAVYVFGMNPSHHPFYIEWKVSVDAGSLLTATMSPVSAASPELTHIRRYAMDDVRPTYTDDVLL